jgi:hypothetical protein
MMPSFIVLHPLQLPAGQDLSGPHITKVLPRAADYSKAEYTNTQQDLPIGDNYFTNSRHDRLFSHWVSFAEKQHGICPYFQDFSTSSSWLFFSMLALYCKNKLCNKINQA